MSGSPRVLFYSHNGVGVGHVQRQVKLAAAYRRRHPDAAILLVTGSHAAGMLDWPPGLDYVKLPSIRMVDRYENWEPRQVGDSIEHVMRLRADLIRQAVRRFKPGLLVADFLPAGPYGELLPALDELAERGGRAVAGFRDIVDDPQFVCALWSRTGVYDVIRERYAGVCVYGMREVVDFEVAYALEPPVQHGIAYTGYLVGGRPQPLPAPARPLVVCTTGGGVDGGALIAAFTAAAGRLCRERGGRWIAITGPLLDEAEYERLAASAVEVVRSVSDLGALLAASDAAVAMVGYNTSCELLASGPRALLVPRSGPSQEQRLRARELERWGVARVLDPDRLAGPALARAIDELLTAPPPSRPPAAVDGYTRAVEYFDAVLAGAEARVT